MVKILDVRIDEFRYRKDTETILEGISIPIAEGSTNVFMGDSGCGKSTLLQILAGILPFFNPGQLKGEVRFRGAPVNGDNIGEYIGRCSYLSQNPEHNIIFTTVEDELIYSLEKRKKSYSEIQKAIKKFIGYFDIEELLGLNIEELSQGQKQLISLSASLIATPEIIFLDEPTSMLDLKNTQAFCSTIKKIKQLYPNLTLLISTHKKKLSKAISTNEYVLEHGKITSVVTNTPVYAYAFESNNGNLLANDAKGYTAQSESILKIENLSFSYNKKDKLLNNINFQLQKSEILWITGPNGGGKTTLLLLIAGLIKPISGRIQFDSMRTSNYKKLLPWHVGLVLQNPDHQIMSSSIRDELSLVFKCMDLPSEHYDPIVKEGISKLNQLTQMSTKDPREASFGQKKMISILSYLHNPDILILDEPDLALDHKNITAMINLLNYFREQGTSIIIVSHNFNLMSKLSNRLLYLNKTIVFDGSPSTSNEDYLFNKIDD